MSALDDLLLAVPNISTSDVGSLHPSVVTALDIHSDIDHGRSVLTYGGTSGSVREACIALTRSAVSLSLTEHVGVHPRFGVIDVLPLVPYSNGERNALDVGEFLRRYIEEELAVPVYTYGRANPDGRPLPALRRFLREHRHPAHASAGVVCLGIRDPLIAFNVDIRAPLGAARYIARDVRSHHVRALGFELASRGLTQVSMNLVAPDLLGPREAFDRVARRGVEIVGCEVVGLVPEPNLAELEGLPLMRPARSIEQALAEKGVL